MRQKGGPLLAAYDTTGKAESETLNFAQRMTRIIECFYRHKTVCKHILDPLYVYNLVDNPTAAERRVESNKLLNRRKSQIMTAGKEAMRIGQRNEPSTPTPTPKTARRTVAQKAPRTVGSKAVARKTPRTTTASKAKRCAVSPTHSDTSKSSAEHDRIFTPSSTPEPTGSEADASPQSLVASVPCSASMLVPQATSYYPQQMVSREPAYHFDPIVAYAAHNKSYPQAYMSNVHSHRMTGPTSYSLPAQGFMSSHPASYYATGSMTDLHVNSSPVTGGTACQNQVATPTKASRKRPSIKITDEMGQPSSAEKKKRQRAS
ncbi:hypothetical protein P170DRAFT_193730 [Aspergillus steynii IBT 23096]|uniref:Uncharacterized protein n=1 Tax=Aspergillus steynii IBT 23096 TaxID=1392250 RepID=A0A2I2G3R4_9EURO|nr:uncharacterized protein P170DRAFT_193730 [Aspergillus steynii IBT 23096]PLB47507.1 hypothetical protein P170DRAFT_193730 [Aspergillus steynii IBT 23096]